MWLFPWVVGKVELMKRFLPEFQCMYIYMKVHKKARIYVYSPIKIIPLVNFVSFEIFDLILSSLDLLAYIHTSIYGMYCNEYRLFALVIFFTLEPVYTYLYIVY